MHDSKAAVFLQSRVERRNVTEADEKLRMLLNVRKVNEVKYARYAIAAAQTKYTFHIVITENCFYITGPFFIRTGKIPPLLFHRCAEFHGIAQFVEPGNGFIQFIRYAVSGGRNDPDRITRPQRRRINKFTHSRS